MTFLKKTHDEILELIDKFYGNDLRTNMLKEGPAPGDQYQAHHGLPWAEVDYFDVAGLDVNDPRFGRWVKGGGNGNHQSWSRRYGNLWKKYRIAHPIPDRNDYDTEV
jgi:hypothetical protein